MPWRRFHRNWPKSNKEPCGRTTENYTLNVIHQSVCKYRRIVFLLSVLLFIISSGPVTLAGQSDSAGLKRTNNHWTALGGYSVTHPGWGSTETRVESSDLIIQYGHVILNEAGRSLYQGRHKILIEVPFSAVFQPGSAFMTGINFLACWEFTASKKIVPYFTAGGGLVYTNLDIPGLGSELNGNYQSGLGLHYFMERDVSIDVNFRLHHISNAGTADPNEPLNSTKLLLGVSFFQ